MRPFPWRNKNTNPFLKAYYSKYINSGYTHQTATRPIPHDRCTAAVGFGPPDVLTAPTPGAAQPSAPAPQAGNPAFRTAATQPPASVESSQPSLGIGMAPPWSEVATGGKPPGPSPLPPTSVDDDTHYDLRISKLRYHNSDFPRRHDIFNLATKIYNSLAPVRLGYRCALRKRWPLKTDRS